MDTCHILPLGPSCIGKTTLVSSVIDALLTTLEQSGGSITAQLGSEDADLLHKNLQSLRSASGTLPQTLLEPTARPHAYTVSVGGSASSLLGKLLSGRVSMQLAFHDYSGALIDDLPAFTSSVLPLAQAEVLLVPVDASLFMEAASGQEEVAAQAVHRIVSIEELIVEWEKGRALTTGRGLLIFAPLRCEAYFGDNGMEAKKEEAERLASLVCNRFFSNIMAIVQFFGENINCLYVPVDTLGHCRVMSREWDIQNPAFRATYAMEGEVRPFGCEMIALFILEYYIRVCRQTSSSKTLEEMEKGLDALIDEFRNKSGYARALRIC